MTGYSPRGRAPPPQWRSWLNLSGNSSSPSDEVIRSLLITAFPSVTSTVLHDNQLTHTDLKPENILFVNSDYSLVYNAEKV